MICLSKGSQAGRCVTETSRSDVICLCHQNLMKYLGGYSDDKRGYLWEAGERKHERNMLSAEKLGSSQKNTKKYGNIILILWQIWPPSSAMIWAGIYTNIYHHALFEDYISSFGFKYDLDTVLYFGASLDWVAQCGQWVKKKRLLSLVKWQSSSIDVEVIEGEGRHSPLSVQQRKQDARRGTTSLCCRVQH